MNVYDISKKRPMIMNIKDVIVPPVLYERINTGEWIDDIVTQESGFIPSFVYMFSGASGAGKSTFLRQLADSLSGRGYIVLYNSTEESEYQIAIAAQKLGLQHGFLISTEFSVDVLLKKCDAIREMHPDQKFVLIHDSMQTMHENPITVTETITKWTKKSESLTFLVCQVTKEGSFLGSNRIIHAVDAHIDMRINKKKGYRYMIVPKNRGGAAMYEDIPYVMTSRGLEVCELPESTFNVDVSNDAPKALKKASKQQGFDVGDDVKVFHKGKHNRKTGRVVKVGRSRVSIVSTDGEDMYVPISWVKKI